MSWLRTFSLAFQTIGVVYGDIGTSPLYVFSSTFSTINDTRDVIGVLSLIIYTLILLPMIKYVFIVLQANDNGDGRCKLGRVRDHFFFFFFYLFWSWHGPFV